MAAPSKWILVVEDDPDFSESLKLSLTQKGFSVIVSPKVGDALTKLNNQKFLCVLLDLRLEDNSGLKIVQQLRHPNAKDSFNFATPIILVSGALEPDVIKSVATKVQAILAKPFKTDVLVAKINELIAGPTSASPQAPSSSKAAEEASASSRLDAILGGLVHDMATAVGTLDLAVAQLTEALGSKSEMKTELEVVHVMSRTVEKMITLIEAARAARL
ncbi:MAG: response regulator [Bdellovibrionales bacterium]